MSASTPSCARSLAPSTPPTECRCDGWQGRGRCTARPPKTTAATPFLLGLVDRWYSSGRRGGEVALSRDLRGPRALLVVKLVNELVEAAERARQADVVAVVAGLDDLAVADADHEDAWQCEGAAARLARVGELEDHQLGVRGYVHAALVGSNRTSPAGGLTASVNASSASVSGNVWAMSFWTGPAVRTLRATVRDVLARAAVAEQIRQGRDRRRGVPARTRPGPSLRHDNDGTPHHRRRDQHRHRR